MFGLFDTPVDPLLTQVYFGNSLEQYLSFLTVILGSIIAAKIAYFIFKGIGRALTARTRSNLDDLLLDKLEEPAVGFIVLAGAFFGLNFLNPESNAVQWLNPALMVAFTLNLTWLIVRVVDAVIVAYLIPLTSKTKSGLDDQIMPLVRQGVSIIIIALALITILSNFGYDVTTIIAGLGILGLAVALAAQDTLANMIAAFTLFADKPFKVGDAVKMGGVSGIVKRIGLRSTRLDSFYGTKITLPNKAVVNHEIENYTHSTRRRYDINLGLVYRTTSAQLKKAIALCQKIAKETEDVEDKCEARFWEFKDSSLNLSVRYW
ncbi:MAG: mechanosensitive ion channel family protein, partial [Candidatus Micrarchaeota archaeon]